MSLRIKGLVLLFIVCYGRATASDSLSRQTRNKRLWYSAAGTGLVLGGGILILNEAWYKEYPRSDFHWIDDNRSWLQMDKCGHVMTASYQSIQGIELMKWAGL